VLFEPEALEGSCVNYGCTPSTAFLAQRTQPDARVVHVPSACASTLA